MKRAFFELNFRRMIQTTKKKYINKIDVDDELELIDMKNYTRDTRDLIISEFDMNKIVNKINTNYSYHLIDAFKCLRDKNTIKFCKIINNNRQIIDIKYDKTYLLHEACRLGQQECVSILLLMGAKCDMFDDNGMMPQHYAAKSGCTLIVDILILFGNSMNIKDKNNNMPIYYATLNQDTDMMRLLFNYSIIQC